jgi:hypothetical protein
MYRGFCLDLDGDIKRNYLTVFFCLWWLVSFTSQSHMVVNVGL